MCRLKITSYFSVNVLVQSVDHWIILITYDAEVIRRYILNLLSVVITVMSVSCFIYPPI